MMIAFAIAGLVLVIVIGLITIGRETDRLANRPRPAIFDIAEAVGHIADRLSPQAQGRLSHEDVRWILLADADLLEGATADPTEAGYPWTRHPDADDAEDADPARHDDDEHTVDEDIAVARILAVADGGDRELEDSDVAEVLHLRNDYLRKIGAVGEVIDALDGEADGFGPTRPAG